jgi:hypothetical protein
VRIRAKAATALLLVTFLTPILTSEATAKTTTCSQKQKSAVKKHITKQINAMGESDWQEAYGYAAKSFQNSISIELFAEIIDKQYEFLIINDGFTFGACKNSENTYSQVVRVNFEGSKRTLFYELTLVGKRLGVVSATEVRESPGLAV